MRLNSRLLGRATLFSTALLLLCQVTLVMAQSSDEDANGSSGEGAAMPATAASSATEQENDANDANDGRQFACFQDNLELRGAVDLYVDEDSSPNSTVARKYGWPIGTWCVSPVRNFHFVFADKQQFNEDVSSWDVSSGTDFAGMFQQATSFNQPLDAWDISNADKFYSMFARATSFNQDLSSWRPAPESNLDDMFADATSFNQDLSSWRPSPESSLNRMFLNATSFRQNLCTWEIPNMGTSTEGMFEGTNCPERGDPFIRGDGTTSSLCFACEQAVANFAVERSEASEGNNNHEIEMVKGDDAAIPQRGGSSAKPSIDPDTEEATGEISMNILRLVHFKLLLSFLLVASLLAVVVVVQKHKYTYIRGIDPSVPTLPEFETLNMEDV